MPDRLQELLRQRALVHEQLAWLDREIATEQGVPPLPPLPASQLNPAVTATAPENKPVTPGTTSSVARPLPPALNDEAEKILGQYQRDPLSTAAQARRAVWLMFFLGLALIGLGFALYAQHLGRWW